MAKRTNFSPFYPHSAQGAKCVVLNQWISDLNGVDDRLYTGWMLAYRGDHDFAFRRSIKLRAMPMSCYHTDMFVQSKNFEPRHCLYDSQSGAFYWRKASVRKTILSRTGWFMWKPSRYTSTPTMAYSVLVPAGYLVPAACEVDTGLGTLRCSLSILSGDFAQGTDAFVTLTDCTIKLTSLTPMVPTTVGAACQELARYALVTREQRHPQLADKYRLNTRAFDLEQSYLRYTVMEQHGKYTSFSVEKQPNPAYGDVLLERPLVGNVVQLTKAISPAPVSVDTDDWLGLFDNSRLVVLRKRSLPKHVDPTLFLNHEEVRSLINAQAARSVVEISDAIIEAHATGTSHAFSAPYLANIVSPISVETHLQQAHIVPLA